MVAGLLARENNQRHFKSNVQPCHLQNATFTQLINTLASQPGRRAAARGEVAGLAFGAVLVLPVLARTLPFQRTFLYDTSLHGHNHAHIRTVPCRPPRLHGAREEGVGSCHPGLRHRTSSSSSSSSSSPSNPAPVWPNPPPVPSTPTTRGSSKPWSTTPLLHTTVGRALVRSGCAGTEGVRADGGKGRERQDMCRCRQAL